MPQWDPQLETQNLPPGQPPGDAADSSSRVSTSRDEYAGRDRPVGAEALIPQQIGRYVIDRILGRGGFGLVYLARDEQLTRPVAVKVPHAHLVAAAPDAEAYLLEARNVARLDHSNIVPVYDVGFSSEFPIYVVSKYIDGIALDTCIRTGSITAGEVPALIAVIADALHHAHRAGLVHRDVKPSNILLDRQKRPFVADFGLALREQDIGRGPRYAGTPLYMSPEQARGEGHRVDGRSDVFSLGVVMYELLTGHRPFTGSTRQELIEHIVRHDPKPMRQWDDALPRELERICNTALAKRASERYPTAKDFADDLRHFLDSANASSLLESHRPAVIEPIQLPPQQPGSGSSDSQPLKIEPKGLRSFDENDADFFVDLLPGPRDRDGLPGSLRFWKSKIREADAEKTFTVGLIYGPSGCGKSSLLKAGLLPRLSKSVLAIHIEATPQDTEVRLHHCLRRHCPLLPDGLTLGEALAALRQDPALMPAKKLLLVIDQFEQWLHSHDDYASAALTEALRQCDGARVQCIVLVRDDFWMAATRFLRELEVRQIEGENCAAVDLFPRKHARKVLAAFGRAFGDLSDQELSLENEAFLDQAIEALAEQDKVICVRLALFADMMKGRPWTPATLRQMGGAEGVGVAFLEGTFNSSSTPPERRWHQRAARHVLQSLLPEAGSEIKGTMRSREDLMAAAGYEGRPQDLADLLHILDTELRLITPTDPEGSASYHDTMAFVAPERKYYQLTHDYLVPSLRQWLTRKERETRRGRARLLLSERAREWEASRFHKRHLLFLPEVLQISLFTASRERTPVEAQLLRRSWLMRGMQAAAATILVAALAGGIYALVPKPPTQLDLLSDFANSSLPVERREAALDALSLSDVFVFPRVIETLKESRDEAIVAPTLHRLEELSRSDQDADHENPVKGELIALCRDLLKDPHENIQRPAFATFARLAEPVEVCQAVRGLPLGDPAMLLGDASKYVRALDLKSLASDERIPVMQHLAGIIEEERHPALVAAVVAKFDEAPPDVLLDWLVEAGVAGDVKNASATLLVPYAKRTRASGRVDTLGKTAETRLVAMANSPAMEVTVPRDGEFLLQSLGDLQPLASIEFQRGLATSHQLLLRRNEIGDDSLDTVLLAFARLNRGKKVPLDVVREILADDARPPVVRNASAVCLTQLQDLESVATFMTMAHDEAAPLELRTTASTCLGEIGSGLRTAKTHEEQRATIEKSLLLLIENRVERSRYPRHLVRTVIDSFYGTASSENAGQLFPLLKEIPYSSVTVFSIHARLRQSPADADAFVTAYLRWKVANPWDTLGTSESPDECLISLRLSASPKNNAEAERAVRAALAKAAALGRDERERVEADKLLQLLSNLSRGPTIDPLASEKDREQQWRAWEAWQKSER